ESAGVRAYLLNFGQAGKIRSEKVDIDNDIKTGSIYTKYNRFKHWLPQQLNLKTKPPKNNPHFHSSTTPDQLLSPSLDSFGHADKNVIVDIVNKVEATPSDDEDDESCDIAWLEAVTNGRVACYHRYHVSSSSASSNRYNGAAAFTAGSSGNIGGSSHSERRKFWLRSMTETASVPGTSEEGPRSPSHHLWAHGHRRMASKMCTKHVSAPQFSTAKPTRGLVLKSRKSWPTAPSTITWFTR
ncbi:hypothetical protein CHUAL_013306, partial [Chamberlinius hualienensis]